MNEVLLIADSDRLRVRVPFFLKPRHIRVTILPYRNELDEDYLVLLVVLIEVTSDGKGINAIMDYRSRAPNIKIIALVGPDGSSEAASELGADIALTINNLETDLAKVVIDWLQQAEAHSAQQS